MGKTARSRLVATLVAGALAATACSGGGGTEGAGAGCAARAGERAAKAVLRCTEGSIGFVETEVSSGTGVVVEVEGKRYVLTNEHVVDPFDAADDGEVLERRCAHGHVGGVDISADVALLGPLTGRDLPAPLALADGTGLERGDDVFLVGFPGEANTDDLEVTIASGIVSRLRDVKEFAQTYIQTDATIAGGQSGGPLFDGDANLVGISGLAFAEGEFALALAGRDTAEAVERILAGDGDEYLSLPGGAHTGGRAGAAGATSGTLSIFDGSDGQVLFLPAAGGDRTWNLTVDMSARPVVTVGTMAGDEPLAVSSNAEAVQGEISRRLAKARGGRPDALPDPEAAGHDPKIAARETRPGTFAIPVKADESALVFVAVPLTDRPVTVGWTSDLPLVAASRPVTEKRLDVGGTLDGIVGGLDTSIDVMVDLAAGQRVQLHARSPQGDPGFAVYTPGTRLDHLTAADPEGAGVEVFDDTDDGLLGLDAKTTFEAEKSGTYRFRLYNNEYTSIHVRFSVVDCAGRDCDATKPTT